MIVPPVPTPAMKASGWRPRKLQLPPDLGTGRQVVGLDVVLVGELAGKERCPGALPRAPRTCVMLPRKPPCSAADEVDGRPEAPDEIDPLGAHPVGHEDRHGVAEGTADGRKRDARVAARGFDDPAAGTERPAPVGLAEDVEGHAVLDAARHVQVFRFGVDRPFPAPEHEIDRQQGGVADQARELLGALAPLFR